jgi:serralysin
VSLESITLNTRFLESESQFLTPLEHISDKNSVRRGAPAVRPNEAIFFQMGSRTYLSVNDQQKGFSPTHDLMADVTGMRFLPGDSKIGALSKKNYFV